MVILGFAENTIQLVPDGSLVLHVVLVLVMVGVLKITLYAPISLILEERERLGKHGLEAASAVLTRVEAKASQYEEALREARIEGYRFLELERQDALRWREQELGAVKEQTSGWTLAQLREIERQVAEAGTTLRAESGKSAVRICSEIMRRNSSGVAEYDFEE
jgi:F0F1-type ATP synthase membrane subunit b/b'